MHTVSTSGREQTKQEKNNELNESDEYRLYKRGRREHGRKQRADSGREGRHGELFSKKKRPSSCRIAFFAVSLHAQKKYRFPTYTTGNN
jgi:hypothetical protein